MPYKYLVNGKEFTSEEKIITGWIILNNSNYLPPEHFDLYKKIQGKEYEPVQLNENVDLSEPGIEKFKVEAREELLYFLDDEPCKVSTIELTAREVLTNNNLDPDEYYLKQMEKNIEINYKEDLDVSIIMLNKPRFISCKKEPTTVSWGQV